MSTQAPAWVPTDTFGSRLLLVRAELHLSCEEAASKCGLKAPTWNTWERGSSPRNMAAVVDAIHQGLGVDRDWLMWGGSRSRCVALPMPAGQMELAFTVPAELAAA